MGLLNLDDNIWTQAVSVIIYLVIVGIWAIIMLFNGLHPGYTPAVGGWGGQSQVLGNIMFNFNFAYVIPSWVNEKARYRTLRKIYIYIYRALFCFVFLPAPAYQQTYSVKQKKSVNVNAAVWFSTILVGISYLLMGFLGAWAFTYPNDEDLLSAINNSSYRPLAALAMITVYVFPIPTFLSGVPVNCIIVKYNLVENKICGKFLATFFAVILPWIVSVPFYT